MGSSRLPGKMMMPLAGKPVLWHVIERAKRLQNIDEVILATTTEVHDELLVKLAQENGIRVYRGSEKDVLDRFIKAGELFCAQIILRINGDVPLFDIETADMIVKEIKKEHVDAVFLYKEKANAIGGFEAVTLDALKRVEAVTTHPYDTFAHEHVTAFLGLNPRYYPKLNNDFTRLVVTPDEKFDIENMRIAVDTKEDYDFMVRAYNRFYKEATPIDLGQVVAFLNSGRVL